MGFFLNCTNSSERIVEPTLQPILEEKIPTFQPRFNRKRPVIAVIGENKYTELSDFIVPYGVLTRSQTADVYALGTNSGPMRMFPALQIEIQTTLSDFDRSFPDGADFVIVPAVHDSENSTLIRWIQSQASKGAVIVGICDGVWLVANSGLLSGKRATGHWYSLNNLEKKFTQTKWIRNRHYVVDKKIITTTGVTASIPVSIALVQSIAGKEKAERIAKEFGVNDWGTEHNTSNFKFENKHYWIAAKNLLSFWSYENIAMKVFPGMDEVTLALVADSYARTFKTNVFAISNSEQTIRTRGGIFLIPERTSKDESANNHSIQFSENQSSVAALNQALAHIADLYGKITSSFVALQIEYDVR
ncbi:transcriptional regulator [Leptospira tipperaryensis]|uniref:Transcriptional regulator n=1 Tax=Leptospira tipperaryensis TaxID=2564040 RepID=A0A1D7V2W8_9LEPT|nr:transcriptional regulator [Leptospira tipperaryensis]